MFNFLNYDTDPSAYTRSLNELPYVGTAGPGGTVQTSAPVQQAPAQQDYSDLKLGAMPVSPQLAVQLYQSYQQPGYIDSMEPQYQEDARRIMQAVENGFGAGPSFGAMLGGGRGSNEMGTSGAPVAGPDFGFMDAALGALAVASPTALAGAIATGQLSTPMDVINAFGQALGVPGAFSDVGVGGHTDDNPRGGAFGGGMTTGAHGGRHGIGGSGGGMGGHGVGGSRGDAY